MLVVSKERYVPVTINTVVLSKEDWYFYVHRDVYDQAVVLSDSYKTMEIITDLIGGPRLNDDTVSWFFENAPKPIHILAPYLSLIDTEIEQDMELCCGVLHAITAMINVRNFINKPVEVRKSVIFSHSIKEEYEMAWDRFFMSAIPYEQRHILTQSVGSIPTGIPNDSLGVITQAEADKTTILPIFKSNSDKNVDTSTSASGNSTAAERKATKNLLK
ncbi:hypothetical protein QFZ81_000147 [Paenibacillus sp. V4I9]|nr:hypothetical protein [Paenibacillus sp. V4I9]